ncbi:MAG: hypothetical protein Tsb0032_23880 [Kiloniellaceae bacterium]
MYDNFYFHVGLHKTASTYLQRMVFPYWPGITYLRHRNVEYFLRLPEGKRYLVSCEGLSGATFAPLAERRRGLERLAEMFPGANVMVGFRPHGGFVASLYSQYVRYGGQATFDGFFSLTAPQDQVIWRREDLCFRDLIECMETAFGKPPFVFQMSELRSNREALLADMAAFMGTPSLPSLPQEEKAQNVSLGAWQGRLLRGVNRWAGTDHTRDGRNRPFPLLRRMKLDPTTVCHKILGRLPGGPLVPEDVRRQIDEAYRDDWDFVTGYISALSSRRR